VRELENFDGPLVEVHGGTATGRHDAVRVEG
jgi:hypothetical protein